MKQIILLLLLSACWQVDAQCWQSVSGGAGHVTAIKTDGTLWSWGNACCYEQSDGAPVTRYNPTQVGTANDWVSISTCYVSSLAFKSDGTLWYWGPWNPNGYIPTQVGADTDWAMGAAGFSSYFAIKTDGTLWGWGTNLDGQLGDGTTVNRPTIIQIGTDNDWLSIAPGESVTMALKLDGTLWGWGTEHYGELGNGPTGAPMLSPVQIGNSNDWESVKCGTTFTIARKTNGTLWTWGRNNTGQLGDGTTVNRLEPAQLGTDSDWETMRPGYFYCYARKTDGTLWAWGSNNFGQLGNGNFVNQYFPFQVTTITDVTDYYGSGFTALFLKTDDSLWASGNNTYGQLGNNTAPSSSALPVMVSCLLLNLPEILSDDALTLHPNPVNDFFKLENNTAHSILSVDIIDVTGKIVLKTNEVSQIHIENLKTGIYTVKIVLDKNVILKKLVKE